MTRTRFSGPCAMAPLSSSMRPSTFLFRKRLFRVFSCCSQRRRTRIGQGGCVLQRQRRKRRVNAAMQTASALRRASGKRVLLADFDLMAGSLGFYLNLEQSCSLVDLILSADHLDHDTWSTMTADADGIDVLPAPDVPFTDAVGRRPASGSRACTQHVRVDRYRSPGHLSTN